MKRALAPLESYAQRALTARLHREAFETRPIETGELTPTLIDYVQSEQYLRRHTAETITLRLDSQT